MPEKTQTGAAPALGAQWRGSTSVKWAMVATASGIGLVVCARPLGPVCSRAVCAEGEAAAAPTAIDFF